MPAPDYIQDSFTDRLKAIIGAHRRTSLEGVRLAYEAALRYEVCAYRHFVDAKYAGRTPESHQFWYETGYRLLTNKWEQELNLANFKDALSRPGVAYVRYGREGIPSAHNYICIYEKDDTSPTGVSLRMTVLNTPEAHTLVREAGFSVQ